MTGEAGTTASRAVRMADGHHDGGDAGTSAYAVFDRAREDLTRREVSSTRLLQTLALVVPVAEGLRAQVADLTDQLTEARTCPLTGLPTRTMWTTLADSILAKGPTAVLLADLDGFKPINDRFGHAVGDAVLTELGARMRTWAESEEAAPGRLGGDEFVVAMTDSPDLTDRVARLHACLTKPFRYQGRTLCVGASIGTARTDDLGTMSPANALSGLLKAADNEMYAVKGRSRRGRRVARFVPSWLRPLADALTGNSTLR
ncbi:GGDEF domain-containing protein [Streptomyces sp. NPDC053474]|uniref:GGDEF domain-containing protein n=1 Tax=Streptomyces sp. NPDC053474 TaxID=3365704 RepID=UPI0037D359F0